MSISRCRRCQAIRPPNARYCPECGTAFGAEGSPSGESPPITPFARNVEFSFWTSVKFGAGFVIGSTLVGFVLWVFILLLVAIGISLPTVRT
jgi:hypothetical protein